VFVDAPANIANGFLNGEQTVSVRLPGLSLTADVPFGGLRSPPTLYDDGDVGR
jgi:hypothetical protein